VPNLVYKIRSLDKARPISPSIQANARRKMSYERTDDFAPGRDRVAYADAVVPVIDSAPFRFGARQISEKAG